MNTNYLGSIASIPEFRSDAGSGTTERTYRRIGRTLQFARSAGSFLETSLRHGSAASLVSRLGGSEDQLTAITHYWFRSLVQQLGVEVTYYGHRHHQPAIYVANHQSCMDIPIILNRLRAIFLARSSIRNWPVIGRLASASGTIFIDSTSPLNGAACLLAIRRHVQAGRNVVVFPEDTSLMGSKLQSFSSSIFRASRLWRIPVVPVTLYYPDCDHARIDDESFANQVMKTLSEPPVSAHCQFGQARYIKEVNTDIREIRLEMKQFMVSHGLKHDSMEERRDSSPVLSR